jgi:hypothetical protein
MRAGRAALGIVAGLALAGPALGQQAGWHFSPFPGEGDRAALACGYGATETEFTCIAVRCEDDYSVGLHIHTSRAGGDAGPWRIDVDKETFEVTAEPDGSPYNARVGGDISEVLDWLKHGAVLYIDPHAGPPVSRNGITLDGSMTAINRALFFCAPRNTETPPAADAAPPQPAEPQLTR